MDHILHQVYFSSSSKRGSRFLCNLHMSAFLVPNPNYRIFTLGRLHILSTPRSFFFSIKTRYRYPTLITFEGLYFLHHLLLIGRWWVFSIHDSWITSINKKNFVSNPVGKKNKTKDYIQCKIQVNVSAQKYSFEGEASNWSSTFILSTEKNTYQVFQSSREWST